MSKGLKVAGLIVGITFINVVILSPGLIGVKIGGSAFQTAFGLTVMFVSLLTLLYGIYNLYFKPVVVIPIKELKTHDDFVQALSRYQEVKVLKDDIFFALEQERRLKKKKTTLLNVLNQRFETNGLTYNRFYSVILDVEKLFYLNLKNILNKVSVFDESEYKSIAEQSTSRFTKEILQEKTELYNEYISFVKKSLNINEEILIDLDKLLLEISRLNNVEIEDIDNLECMKEIDLLIQQTKQYKH